MQDGALPMMDDTRLRRFAVMASISVATILIIAKLTAYLMTDSVTILSSLLDSTVDLLASLVTAYGVASALRPPDREHRFGHGKAEALAALAQAAFIVGSSVLLCYEAIGRFYKPRELHNTAIGYGVTGLAIALTLILLGIQKYAVRRTGSLAIGADKLHYSGDLWLNLAVLAALFLQPRLNVLWVDPLMAVGIGVFLIANAVTIVREALDVLMDRELPEADRDKLLALASGHPHVRGAHDLRTRSDSERIFVEMHMELDPAMTVRAAHAVVDSVMASIRAHYPNADILLHQDPAGLTEDRLDAQIERNAQDGTEHV